MKENNQTQNLLSKIFPEGDSITPPLVTIRSNDSWFPSSRIIKDSQIVRREEGSSLVLEVAFEIGGDVGGWFHWVAEGEKSKLKGDFLNKDPFEVASIEIES